ncbi:MAG: (2,3-dihydroxybenzoyl)adenylate synthase [Solirubrobacteraceae bacterium]
MLAGCTPWPESEARRYREAGVWDGSRLGDLAAVVARRAPERVAVVAGTQRLTYAELDARADGLAAGLWQLGLRPGARIVVALPNCPELLGVSIAAFRIGAIPIYALASHRRHELEYLARHVDAAALVVPDRHQDFDFRPLATDLLTRVPTLEHALVVGDPGPLTPLDGVAASPWSFPQPSPQEVAFMLLSGGTTGMPKLIPRTHDDYALQLRLSAAAIGATEETVYLAALPVAHNAALGCPGALGTLTLGGRVVLAGSPSPDEIFGLVERERPTLTTAMPAFLTLWSELADAFGADLAGMVVEVGGARMAPEVALDAGRRLSCTVTQWFGMAEGVLCCTRPDDPPETAAHTQGLPVCALDEFRVLDPDGRDVAAGDVGELAVRGPMTLRGYYRAADYNARSFTPDGFLLTGDLVRFDPVGRLVVTGRAKDVINRGGEKVSPGELEDEIRSHPAVRDVALVGYPDPVLGERVCAVLVLGGDGDGAAPSVGELRQFLSARGIADYKLPDRIELLEALPHTRLGKVDRAAVRTALHDGSAAASGGPRGRGAQATASPDPAKASSSAVRV